VSPRLTRPASLVALLLLLGGGAVRAQEESEPSSADWRQAVDALLDRWHDGVGPRRLERARDLLASHAAATPTDGLALIDLGRLELALDHPEAALKAVEEGIGRFTDEETSARRALAATNAERATHHLDPLEPGPELTERRARALALAYLAATEVALAKGRALEGDAATTFLQERQAELSRRRQALFTLAGEEQGANLVREETMRRRELRTLDRLGLAPRPIGQPDAAGQAVDLGAYKGKVLLVLFWSQALGGCEEVLTAADAVAKELGPRGLEVVGVCLDAPGGPASQWLADHGVAWRQVFTNDGLMSRDARAWGVDTIPAGVLVDHTGMVRYVDPWEGDLKLAVQELLRRKDEADAAAGRRSW
jgi:hypothetical protein